MIKYLKKGKSDTLKIQEEIEIRNKVEDILKELKKGGDKAVLKLSEKFDNKFDEEKQRETVKKIVSMLKKEGVANDINGYPKAPPSIRIWGGSTVQNSDMKALLPWIDWAYNSIKNNA